jgi:uncharacterized membrane protein YuzA (DUF378 family)
VVIASEEITVLPHKKRVIDEMSALDRAAGTMMAIGAINWGLVGATNFDVIRATLGRDKARVAYGLVGASAAYAMVRGRQLASR